MQSEELTLFIELDEAQTKAWYDAKFGERAQTNKHLISLLLESVDASPDEYADDDTERTKDYYTETKE